MTKELNKEKVNIICPHCALEIDEAYVVKLKTNSIIRFIYFCGRCNHLLSVSQDKQINIKDFQKPSNPFI